MRIKLDIAPSVREPEVIIRAGEETETIREIVSFIRQRTEEDTGGKPQPLTVQTSKTTVCTEMITIYRGKSV